MSDLSNMSVEELLRAAYEPDGYRAVDELARRAREGEALRNAVRAYIDRKQDYYDTFVTIDAIRPELRLDELKVSGDALEAAENALLAALPASELVAEFGEDHRRGFLIFSEVWRCGRDTGRGRQAAGLRRTSGGGVNVR